MSRKNRSRGQRIAAARLSKAAEARVAPGGRVTPVQPYQVGNVSALGEALRNPAQPPPSAQSQYSGERPSQLPEKVKPP